MDLNRWANDPWLKWRAISAVTIFTLVIIVAFGVGIAASQNRPSGVLVDQIEALMTVDSCARPLEQWWREYSFKRRYGPQGTVIDHNVVWVSLIEAGHADHPAGRFIHSNPEPVGIDDSQFRLAFGEYDVAHHRFTRWVCGPNWPPGKGPR